MDLDRAARQAAADDAGSAARRDASCRRSMLAGIELARRRYSACCSFLPSPTRRSWSRSAIARSAACARAIRWSARGRCRSPTSPSTLLRFRRLRGRGDGDRRAHAAGADRCAGVGTHGGRRGDHQHRRRGDRAACATSSCRPTGWRRPGIRARTPRSTTPCARSRSSSARRWASASRSARIRCRCARRGARADVDKAVTAPVSLIVSAFAASRRRAAGADAAAAHATPRSALLLVDLGNGRNRLGGSALAQVYGQLGNVAPDVDDRRDARGVLRDGPGTACAERAARLSRSLRRRPVRRRWRRWPSPAGAVSTIVIDELPGLAVERCSPRSSARCCRSAPRTGASVVARVRGRGARAASASASRRPTAAFASRREACNAVRSFARRFASRLVGDDACAAAHARQSRVAPTRNTSASLDADDPGLVADAHLRSGRGHRRALSSRRGARPRIAILREQGVNGQVEMAAAFDRAGFAAFDVHMSDIISGPRRRSPDFAGFAACGGFSYGDVLGAGEGWAKSILFNARARDEFAAFFARGDTFALGVCNGCQMMSNLHELIPGTEHWPHFVRNRSEQFEARFVLLEVQRFAVAFLRRHGGQPHPGRAGARRGLRRVPRCRAARRCRSAGDAALCRQPRRRRPSATRTIRTARRRGSPASRRPTDASRS